MIIKFTHSRWDDSFYSGGVFIAISGFLAYIIGSVPMENNDDDEDENNNDDTDDRTKVAPQN